MSESNLVSTAPVVLIVFNRPAHTRQVLKQLRLARPSTLLVVADGPRADRPEDGLACTQVRELIHDSIDWGPRLLTNFAEQNMGLKGRIASGLSWVFEQVDRAIILEDDCVPDVTFFRYCSELLEYYRDDSRVGTVTGDNYQNQPFACPHSYYFSRYPHCWGWATWRRAWRLYDGTMRHWPELREDLWHERIFPHPEQARYWRRVFDATHQGTANSWSFAWAFSCWSQSLLTATPKANLVRNVGFGADATHTKGASSPHLTPPVIPMEFPLRHPPYLVRHEAADDFVQRTVYKGAKSGRRRKWKRIIRKWFG